MAKLISEVIEPGSLFVPVAKDLFTVGGDLPNGEPSLRINQTGRGNNSYWARQPAEAGRNFFVAAPNTSWSLSFWALTGSGFWSTTNDLSPSAVLFGCWGTATPISGNVPQTTNGNIPFAFAVSAASGSSSMANLRIFIGGVPNSVGNGFDMGGTGTGWRFYAVTVSYNSSGHPTVTRYVNGNVHATSTAAADASVQNSASISASGYFGIGSITDNVWTTGASSGTDVRLGKVALHDRALTHDEVIALNDAMLYGP